MEIVTSKDGTPIAYARSGSGPPLALVYGNSDVSKFWDLADVRRTIAERFTVYIVERRGKGESGDHKAYALEREVEDVVAVIESIDEPVTLLGHSGGAIYSLEAALLTDNLSHLILYEPPIQVGYFTLDIGNELDQIKSLVDDGELEQALLLFLCDIAQLSDEEMNTFRSDPIWRDMVMAATTLYRELKAIGEYEFHPIRFAKMDTPSLLLTGSESPPFFRAATEAVNKALPDSRITVFEGQGHAAMLTATERFIEEVVRFIQ